MKKLLSRKKAIKAIEKYKKMLKELASKHIEMKKNRNGTVTFWDNRDGFEIITIPKDKINEYSKEVILAYRHELEIKKKTMQK